MKTDKNVSVAMVVATVSFISTATMFGAQNCSDRSGAFTTATCCDRISADARPAGLVGNPAVLTPVVNSEMQFQRPTADEVERILPQGVQNLLTSAGSSAKAPAFEEHVGLRYAQTLGSLTNNFARLELQTADAQSKETKPFPLEFSGQTDIATRAADRLSVPRNFTSSDDALISGSKATGFSFAFSRSARSQLSAKAKAVGETGDWRVRATPDFSQFAKDGFGGGENWARREPQGLRFFSWRW